MKLKPFCSAAILSCDYYMTETRNGDPSCVCPYRSEEGGKCSKYCVNNHEEEETK